MISMFDRISVVPLFTTVAADNIGTAASSVTGNWVSIGKANTIAIYGYRTQTNTAATDVLDVFKMQIATDASGTGAADVSGAAISTFTGTGAVGSVVCVEVDTTAVRAAEDAYFIANGSTINYTHFTAVVSLGTDSGTNQTIQLVGLKFHERYTHQGLFATQYVKVG